ncbi:MAG TPA: hypothetical protein VFC19_16910 [Candidatus Limnocylindrales bacterium]|nr:hypothetical protein [Candidatus Limnocylindrales bacterium]
MAKTAVEIETKDATDLAGGVIVVHMFRVRRAADPTPAALSQDDPPNLLISNVVTPLEMIVARAANVVARQAVAVVAAGFAFVERKVFERFHGLAVGTPPEALWSLEWCSYFTSMPFEHALAIALLGTLVVAELAITAMPVPSARARVEVAERQRLAAVAACPKYGSLPISKIGHILSFPPFLDISAHELFGVLFENGVDLVEEVVDVLADLLHPLGNLGVDLGGNLVDVFLAPLATGLRLSTVLRSHLLCPPNFECVKRSAPN